MKEDFVINKVDSNKIRKELLNEMKNVTLKIITVFLLLVVLILTQNQISLAHSPGQLNACAIGNGAFNLRYVPGPTGFPTGTDDSGICTAVNYGYWMADTEVTYNLWAIVRDWATSADLGAGRYFFQNFGVVGDGTGTGTTDRHPVTRVGWRDAMVWCNALTEYYNSQNNTNYTCVYTYYGTIIRDSRDSYATVCDSAVPAPGAKGFRLPTSMEWDLVARYQNGTTWTPGSYASGAAANYLDAAATGAVAWYQGNSGNTTHPVGTKAPNNLGLYDMSGNVGEYCFDLFSSSTRVFRGGAYSTTQPSIRLDQIWADGGAQSYIGFRLVRN